jgi:hypothetical protein
MQQESKVNSRPDVSSWETERPLTRKSHDECSSSNLTINARLGLHDIGLEKDWMNYSDVKLLQEVPLVLKPLETLGSGPTTWRVCPRANIATYLGIHTPQCPSSRVTATPTDLNSTRGKCRTAKGWCGRVSSSLSRTWHIVPFPKALMMCMSA